MYFTYRVVMALPLIMPFYIMTSPNRITALQDMLKTLRFSVDRSHCFDVENEEEKNITLTPKDENKKKYLRTLKLTNRARAKHHHQRSKHHGPKNHNSNKKKY